jgi:diaminopimelate epimerase
MRELEIVVADPAKNISVFVLSAVENRAETAKALLADPALKAEQVGFVIPPAGYAKAKEGGGRPETPEGIWRLEMMGGEFCGNAARAFGLLVARKLGLSGELTLFIEISGARGPLPVRISTSAGTAEVDMPKPLQEYSLAYDGKDLPVIVFEGITQLIAPDTPPSRETFFAVKKIVEQKCVEQQQPFPGALGLMFLDTAKNFMRPAVYVYATDSLVFESSCGSGSAALALWQSRSLRDGEARAAALQPGGLIDTRVKKSGGKVVSVSIGGRVSLGGEMKVWR